MTPEAVIGGLLIVGSMVWRYAQPVPAVPVEFWQYITYSGAFFLGIGLVRDLLIKFLSKPGCAPKRAGEKTICFESLFAPIFVLGGLAVLAAGVEKSWQAPLPYLGCYAGVLFIVSGLTKDIVIVFRKEKNHINVIPY